APNVPLGNWFDVRGGQMELGVPDNKSAPLISIQLAGPVNGKRGFYEWDKNNFAPRFAFAYSPKSTKSWLKGLTGGESNKMAVRGGYSVVFDRIGGAIAVNADSGTLGFGLQTSVTNPAGTLTALTTPRFTGISNLPASLLLPAAGFG